MSTVETRKSRLPAALGRLLGEAPAPKPVGYENWYVEEWERLLANRTPEKIAQEPNPAYLVREPLVIPLSQRIDSVRNRRGYAMPLASFAVDVFSGDEDLASGRKWSASAHSIVEPSSEAIKPEDTLFGEMLCQPGTDRVGAIEAVDTWIYASFPFGLEISRELPGELTEPEKLGEHRFTITYKAGFLNA